MTNDRRFYIYAYLREDGTPYYIGRGQRYRMHNVQQHVVGVPPRERRVKLIEHLTHEEANKWEVATIAYYGRKDNGTGILRNLTDGGNEGNTGWVPSPEYREDKRDAMIAWHAANPGANGAAISAAKMGHDVSDDTRNKIAATLISDELVERSGLTVQQLVDMGDVARRRIQRQLDAGFAPCPDATLKEIKAAERHGLTVAQWRSLTALQRKHIARTKERAASAGVRYFTWIQLSKPERISLSLAAA